MIDMFLIKGAVISECGQYRPWLWRIWDISKPPLILAMLNPSTGDDYEDDRTIGRGCGFARRDGFGGIGIVNMSAFRSTKPENLRMEHFGPHNRVLNDILMAAQAFGGKVCCGWGDHPIADDTADWFRARARHIGVTLYCLGRTKRGYPRHPLYVKGDQLLEVFQ